MSVLDQFDLSERVALVTGGASGIGYAFASAMAEAGADVALVDVDETAAAEAAEDLGDATGERIIPVHADVSDENDTARMVEQTREELGGLDVAFANAGIAELGAPIEWFSTEQWQDVIDVNLSGVFNTMRDVAGPMTEQGHGSIVTTASIYGEVGDPKAGMENLGGSYAYTASKGGVIQLTRTLAVELAPEVRVNAIAPAFVRTDLASGALWEDPALDEVAEFHEQIEDRTLLERFADPEEVKGMALFLASDASSYCTGGVYHVDGGWLAL